MHKKGQFGRNLKVAPDSPVRPTERGCNMWRVATGERATQFEGYKSGVKFDTIHRHSSDISKIHEAFAHPMGNG